MVPKKWIDYINDYILLTGEAIDLSNIEEIGGVIHLNIVKRTVRTRRIVTKLTIGINDTSIPPKNLINTFSSPNVKRQFKDTTKTFEWVRNGWVIREYRLKKDERTIDREHYRMGYALFRYQQKLNQQRIVAQKEQLVDWLNKWEVTNHSSHESNLQRSELLIRLKRHLSIIAEDVRLAIDQNLDHIKELNVNWRFKKQVTLLHFLLALYQISITEPHFDWKEIGARYYQSIGGSKMFDLDKKVLIEQAQILVERPLHLFGLTTLGTITPIYFSGPMKSTNAIYHYGSVHATTDLAVFTAQFETTAEILWLVENRGVLTRMAYEKEFLKISNSFVLAIDGHLRSSHRRLIQNLISDVKQVIIWTDVDEAGLVIGKDAANLVESSDAIIKWVVPPLEVVTSPNEFTERYQQMITINKEEQEQAIGGVELWKQWIKN